MSDYHLYIPYVNRPDLLRMAVDSLKSYWLDLTILDNSVDGLRTEEWPCYFIRPVQPLTFTQSQNCFFSEGKKDRKEFIIWMHNDAIAPPGAVRELIDAVCGYTEEGRKWGVAFTYYDILSAVNLKMVEEVGGYDTGIRAYKSDQDFYRRVRLAGWETIDTEIQVEAIKAGHLGSQTIRSDGKLNFLNGIIQKLDSAYYVEKWGGDAGHEVYDVPFNRTF